MMETPEELIAAALKTRRPTICKPAFAQGCEIATLERKLIRKSKRAA